MYYLWYIVKSAFIDFWRYEIMEFWRFIFSSFWVWLGFIILVSMVGGGVIELVKACKPEKRRVQTFRNRDVLRVDIVGASVEEAKAAREEVTTAEWDGCKYKLKNDGEPEQGDQGNV